MAASDVNEGPVLNLINKRLRALRKKYNKIIQMEEAVSQGKTLNKEQEETLRSKSSVAGAIEELEKLHQPLAVAVAEEIDAAVSHRDGDAQAHEGDGQVQISDADKGSVIEDLLNLLYFGSMFDVKSQNDFATMVLRKTHERGCCLTYDYVTDDDADLLGERDLDLISMLGELMMSRPVDSSLSHKNALQRCIEHAKLWLTNANHPVGPDSNITYGALRAKLNKIMASDYFTTSPEMKAPVEVAAAAESYKSYQVPVQQAEQYEQKEDELENSQGQEDEQSTPVEYQQQQQDSSVEVDGEVVSAVVAEGEGQKDQQQHGPRRFQNYRSGNRGGGGGGRRGGGGGYINGGRGGGGRGGRGYTNGGGRNQYYDQTGNSNYYPRNNYNNFRGRGGRGGNPGGNNNYNQGGASAYVAVGDSS